MHLSISEVMERIRAAALAGDLAAATLRDSIYAAADHLSRKWGECQDAQRNSDYCVLAAARYLQSVDLNRSE